ncbi:MAG: hypothetical protein K1X75_18185 [Leptospirales bacterium]|nr:hypothetical protein [Leptospirales bacterium]
MTRVSIESIFRNAGEIAAEIAANPRPWRLCLKLFIIILACGGAYGLTMGLAHSWLQSLSAGLKTPLLYILTLAVCLPTLHFIGLFLGSRFTFWQSMAVLLMGVAVNAALLFGFASISLFFLATGAGYRFLLFMHVLFFAVSGFAGLVSIHRTHKLLANSDGGGTGNASLLQAWMLLYMFVGTQMAFTLSPFVGRETAFYWFHHPDKNFYSYLWASFVERLDDHLPAEQAKALAFESTRAVLYALQERDFQALAAQIAPEDSLRIIPQSYSRESRVRDIHLNAAQLLEFSGKNLSIPMRQEYDRVSGKMIESSLPFATYYDQYLYDVDYAAALEAARYNEFSLGVQNKETIFAAYPKAIIVEVPVLLDRRRWRALRLVFAASPISDRPGALLPLRAIIHDQSAD